MLRSARCSSSYLGVCANVVTAANDKRRARSVRLIDRSVAPRQEVRSYGNDDSGHYVDRVMLLRRHCGVEHERDPRRAGDRELRRQNAQREEKRVHRERGVKRRKRVEVAVVREEQSVHRIARHDVRPRTFDRKYEKEREADQRDDEETARVAAQLIVRRRQPRQRQEEIERLIDDRPSRIEWNGEIDARQLELVRNEKEDALQREVENAEVPKERGGQDRLLLNQHSSLLG